MLIIVDQNEAIDRNKIDGNGVKQTKNLSNMRAYNRLKQYFPKIQKAELACGDINIILESGKMLAVERKQASDFIGSIAEGHIFRQVENMANNADWSCIIIEGLISFDKDDMTVIPIYDENDNVLSRESTNWKGVSVRAAMFAIQWSGCPIMMTEPKSLPYVVDELASFCSKPSDHTQSLGRKRIVTFPPISLNEEIISAFPGVGLKRSRSLLEHSSKNNDSSTATLAEALAWGSCLNLINRKSRPEGWGDKIIENFRVALGLNPNQYLDVKEEKNNVSKPKKK